MPTIHFMEILFRKTYEDLADKTGSFTNRLGPSSGRL